MPDWMIEPATREDAEWIKPIFVAERGAFWDFGRVWWRYWEQVGSRERWDVIRPLGFIHYRLRRDGIGMVYEIAVSAAARRRGIGRALMARVGEVALLKTDATNLPANAFYQSLGFRLTDTRMARDGVRIMNVYER